MLANLIGSFQNSGSGTPDVRKLLASWGGLHLGALSLHGNWLFFGTVSVQLSTPFQQSGSTFVAWSLHLSITSGSQAPLSMLQAKSPPFHTTPSLRVISCSVPDLEPTKAESKRRIFRGAVPEERSSLSWWSRRRSHQWLDLPQKEFEGMYW